MLRMMPHNNVIALVLYLQGSIYHVITFTYPVFPLARVLLQVPHCSDVFFHFASGCALDLAILVRALKYCGEIVTLGQILPRFRIEDDHLLRPIFL